MKTDKYTIREFFSDSGLHSVVIPEIQRDYVWGEYQVKQLLNSIFEDYSKYKTFSFPQFNDSIRSEVRESFENYYKRNQCSANIGFIYAYTDPEADGNYFLIDGQQRLSTIFLTLLALTSCNENTRAIFRRTFMCKDESTPKLDYRVRENAHQFLAKLTLAAISSDKFNFNDIKRQSWYLNDYSNDQTICSIISNIGVVQKLLSDNGLYNAEFMDYVMNYIEFWYFDTSISEQGEDLYIFMNARGESMQSHENLKADLIGKLKSSDEKQNAGKKWENWQDLFWKERNRNPNADQGFNEFLRCISGLEYVAQKQYSDADYDNDGYLKVVTSEYGMMKDTLCIERIEDYIDALQILKSGDLTETFQQESRYNYVSWISKAINDIWDIFNNQTTNWFVSLTNDKRSTEHQRMTYVWSILKYIVESRKAGNYSINNLIRTLRIFYVRYHNNDRAVTTSLGQVSDLVNNGPWYSAALRSGEETTKYSYLRNTSSSTLAEIEQLIWEIEDHPLNLDGKDVGAINCSHLINFKDNIDAGKLQNIKDTFYSLFECSGDDWECPNGKELLNELLFQSMFYSGQKAFWLSGGPWYYKRLDFLQWKKIIRGIGAENNTVFTDYFNNKLNGVSYNRRSVADIESLMSCNDIKKEDITENNIIYALCWYAAKNGTAIWQEGRFITFNYEGETPDKNFPGVRIIRNFKGDYKGGNPKVLSDL